MYPAHLLVLLAGAAKYMTTAMVKPKKARSAPPTGRGILGNVAAMDHSATIQKRAVNVLCVIVTPQQPSALPKPLTTRRTTISRHIANDI
uniref:Truncated putative phospholipase A2 n=1 Tax=Austrelaps labialis TaxID=471292 RepID=B2BRT0_AUSLA|nr:truncated putative phospholipase A2 [Austrelaps labialis]